MTSPEDAIAVLNRINEADPTVMPKLIQTRVPCNDTVADDPTVQVKAYDGEPCTVGILGIINGIFGTRPDNKGFICVFYDADRNITHFGFTPEDDDDCGAKPK